jgi:hypothetical protein
LPGGALPQVSDQVRRVIGDTDVPAFLEESSADSFDPFGADAQAQPGLDEPGDGDIVATQDRGASMQGCLVSRAGKAPQYSHAGFCDFAPAQ